MSYVLLTVVTCPPLTHPDNGMVITSNSNNYQSSAIYTCTTGFIFTASSGGVRMCGADGQWTGDAPTCPRELVNNIVQRCDLLTAVNCGNLTVPMNGIVDTSSGTTYQETATYTCNDGYQLVGALTRTCQDNGEWSLSAPTCRGKGISWSTNS